MEAYPHSRDLVSRIVLLEWSMMKICLSSQALLVSLLELNSLARHPLPLAWLLVPIIGPTLSTARQHLRAPHRLEARLLILVQSRRSLADDQKTWTASLAKMRSCREDWPRWKQSQLRRKHSYHMYSAWVLVLVSGMSSSKRIPLIRRLLLWPRPSTLFIDHPNYIVFKSLHLFLISLIKYVF